MTTRNEQRGTLTTGDMLELRRWNTPTIYNGWEQITQEDSAHDAFNLEECVDFMPHMGPMVGRAITVVIEPGNAAHSAQNPHAWSEYRNYVASVPGPKIVVVQDLDKPQTYGAFWGEVNSTIHRALGCVGTIADGAIRDLDEMNNAGFKAVARRLCVGHARSWPVRWDVEVEVFGRRVKPGQLIHADKHGFLVVREEEEPGLLEASRYLDSQECLTMIAAARDSVGMTSEQVLKRLDAAAAAYKGAVELRYPRKGEF
jgi:4-hydroxy-4-methyl-2-oxoglutarate aldolase